MLHVVKSMGIGGRETYLLNLLRGYDRSRFEMDVCYTGPDCGILGPEVTALGSRLRHCRYTNAMVPFVWTLARLLRTGNYDAVCDFGSVFAAASMWAGRLAGVPIRIAFYRTGRTKYRPTPGRRAVARLLHHSVLWHATAVLSNSHANLATAFRPREIDERFAVVHNGVDLMRFRPAGRDVRHQVRRELAIPEEATIIGHVGRFIPLKAHDVLVDAFAELVGKYPGAHLLLVGDGPTHDQVRQRVERLGFAARVTFTGVRHDVHRLLQAMDLFVLPSRVEGFPNALLEAQAVGLPVVASDRAEIREAMPAANHDCLARIDVPGSFAEKMAAILGDRPLAHRRGAAGARFVEQHLEISRSIAELCRYFAAPTLGRRGVRAAESPAAVPVSPR